MPPTAVGWRSLVRGWVAAEALCLPGSKRVLQKWCDGAVEAVTSQMRKEALLPVSRILRRPIPRPAQIRSGQPASNLLRAHACKPPTPEQASLARGGASANSSHAVVASLLVGRLLQLISAQLRRHEHSGHPVSTERTFPQYAASSTAATRTATHSATPPTPTPTLQTTR